MTAISPEAQALIDRLHAVDLARPKLDSEAVENAFNRHLEVLGLPLRPIRAMPDASSAYRRMIDLADATSRLDATRAARSTWYNRELAARNAAHGLALHISRGVCTDDAYFEAQSAANAATAKAARDAGER